MQSFHAKIELIGINPFVFVPKEILESIFAQAGVSKGHIPIRGSVNEFPFTQTLVKYAGEWRLYINMKMLPNSPKRIGETISISVEFDPEDRSIDPNDQLVLALSKNSEANAVFEGLTKSKQQEIVRYISRLKTEESIEKNVARAINFLNGKERFLGREKP